MSNPAQAAVTLHKKQEEQERKKIGPQQWNFLSFELFYLDLSSQQCKCWIEGEFLSWKEREKRNGDNETEAEKRQDI